MLLFCKQVQQNRRFIYCVELDTLEDVQPRVHRFLVSHKRYANMELGQLYRLEVRGIRIVHAILENEYSINEADYELLMELRQMRFDFPVREYRREQYFSFAEMCDLFAYKEPPVYRFCLFLLRMAGYALCGLFPLALYVLLIYAHFFSGDGEVSSFAGPVVLLGALPFMIYLVKLLHTAYDALLLEWKVTRFGMLRSSVQKSCGIKRSLGIPRVTVKKLVKYGILCFGVFLVCSVISLVL